MAEDDDVPDAVIVSGDKNVNCADNAEEDETRAIQENYKIGRVYPGDLVVYKNRHPWDWSPTYGTVLLHRKNNNTGRFPPSTPNSLNSAKIPLPRFTNGPDFNVNDLKSPTIPQVHKNTNEDAVITVEEQPTAPSSTDAKKGDASQKEEGTSAAEGMKTETPSDGLETAVAQDYGENPLVHWDSSNRVRQMKRSEVCIIDRMLVRGTRVRNHENISGSITNYNVKATLQIVGTNHVIQNVPLNELHPISTYVRGQEVFYKNWVGMITNVKRKVWFRLDSGLTFHIETTESDGFMKTDPYWGLGVACPGVRTPFSTAVLKNAKWTSKYMRFFWKWVPPISYLYSFSSATVTRVEAVGVTVKWLDLAPNAPEGTSIETPPETDLDIVQMQQLEILSMPSAEYAGLNSVRIYRMSGSEQLTTYGAWFSQFRHKFMEHGTNRAYSNFFSTPTTPLRHVPGSNTKEVPVKILLRQNYVDVLWDDGKSERLSSIDIPFVYEPPSHDTFRIGMVVLSDTHPPESKIYGIVQLSEELLEEGTSTLRVHWWGEGEEKERIVHDEGITEESVFSLRCHPFYSLYQRETVLFSTNPSLHEFNAGIVIDVDVREGNMIVFCTDHRYRKVWPHMVSPFSKRCSWNFFTRKWVVDAIIPPPHQLGIDLYPKNPIRMALPEIENALVKLKMDRPRGLFEEPPFDLLETAPETHWYIRPQIQTVDSELARIVRGEFDLIRSNVPDGVWIRVYENRMDLVSVMIAGPPRTPYEDGIYLFDMKLPSNFPHAAPKVHLIAYTKNEVHPLFGDDGNFCEASLRWESTSPQETDTLQPKSFILEAIRAIHGFFFTSEPYLSDGVRNREYENEEEQEKSRGYNEMIFLQVLDIYYEASLKPHDPWKRHIAQHVLSTLPYKISIIEKHILETGKTGVQTQGGIKSRPDEISYPLLPVSKGFQIALEQKLEKLRYILKTCTDSTGEAGKVERPVVEQVTGEDVKKEEEYKEEPSPVKDTDNSLMHTIEEILHEHAGTAQNILKTTMAVAGGRIEASKNGKIDSGIRAENEEDEEEEIEKTENNDPSAFSIADFI